MTPPGNHAALARRYAAWVERRRAPILVAGAILAAASTVLAVTLPLKTDLQNLLPPSERSVGDLEALSHRTRILGTVLCAIVSDDASLRRKAADDLAARIRKLDPTLVSSVVTDDSVARRFGWENRFLFAPLADLVAARDGLRSRLDRAKLDANPLFVPLDDDDPGRPPAHAGDPLDRLRAQLHDAERQARSPAGIVSKDGKVQLLIVYAPFSSSVVSRGQRLVAALAAALATTRREVGPGVDLGMTEDVVTAVAEHRAILDGMVIAVLLTVSIVGASLLLYYRSMAAVLALLGALAVGTLGTFGLTHLTVGHLNSVTAFLSSIVVGNGINFGVIVLARYLEERRRGSPAEPALASALGGSFRGTLSAALAAGVAYASLIVTDFRGFRDFGVIGGLGMVLCWLAAYSVLPAGLSLCEQRGFIRPRREPGIGPLLARLFSRRAGVVTGCGAAAVACTVLATWHYLATDPFEYNWQKLRSSSAEAVAARRWMHRIDEAFGRGLAGGFVVGVDRREDLARVASVLKEHAEDIPGAAPGGALFRRVGTIDDYLPADQRAKLPVLAEIRRLLDDRALDALDDGERADARRFRPPEGLHALTAADVPEALAGRFVEQDGSRGRLLFANQALRFDGWNGRHMMAFVRAVRALGFPPGTRFGGGAFVFADVVRAVAKAGPRATLAALAGVGLFVLVVIGPGRHALITLFCAAAGTTAMIAGAWLVGLKVNFLDFVALPITLGISVDYAVNVVMRERDDGPGTARHALATTGGAVVLCSWTTIVGYGSLLLSANEGIRSFGLTAILGEATCLLAALTLAPALLSLGATRARPLVGQPEAGVAEARDPRPRSAARADVENAAQAREERG